MLNAGDTMINKNGRFVLMKTVDNTYNVMFSINDRIQNSRTLIITMHK